MKRISTIAGDVYMADEVDARIQAEIACMMQQRKAKAEAEARAFELEKALRLSYEVLSGHALSKQDLIDALQAIKKCGL